VEGRLLEPLAALLAALALATPAAGDSARTLSQRALERIDAQPYDRDAVAEATLEARRAVALDASEPRAQLALALAELALGYRGGDPFEAGSYREGALERSRERTDFALARGPDLARAHAHAGFLDLLGRQWTRATRRMQAACELDPHSHHAWCYTAALRLERGEADGLETALHECESRAASTRQPDVANVLRLRIARRRGDLRAEEALHREILSRAPQDPYAHGRYADFLMRERRYAEAVRHFRRAIALEPYPAALRGLEKAELRRRFSRGARQQPDPTASTPSPNASARPD